MLPTGAAWEVPEPESTFDLHVGDDTTITIRRYGNPRGPRLVLSHGNGFAIDLYYPVLVAPDSRVRRRRA